MPPSDAARLRHMLDAALQALEFGDGRTPDDLILDRMRAFAILRCIEIVGEAAANLTNETRRKYPEVPWGDIIGMRNRLVHAYFDIDLDRVCDTVASDIPLLLAELRRIIADAGASRPAPIPESDTKETP